MDRKQDRKNEENKKKEGGRNRCAAMGIFRRDAGRLLHNRAAMLVAAGICILPSLYAWFNIGANMDPYGNTQGIRIAAVNEDKGFAAKGQGEVNAGAKVMEKLKENEKLGWTFVGKEEAVQGVKGGRYYAAIVIPEDFSESLAGIFSGKLHVPEAEYYVNEKKNAIAPKITETGVDTVRKEIDKSFAQAVSETAAKLWGEEADRIVSELKSTGGEVASMLERTEENLEKYKETIRYFQKTEADGKKLISDTQRTLGNMTKAADAGKNTMKAAGETVKKARKGIRVFSGKLSDTLADGEEVFGRAGGKVNEGLAKVEEKALAVNTKLETGLSGAEEALELNREILEGLERLNERLQSDAAAKLLAGLKETNTQNEALAGALSEGNESIAASVKTAQKAREKLEKNRKEGQEKLRAARDFRAQTVMPKAEMVLDTAAGLSGEMSGVLRGIEPSAAQMGMVLEQMEDGLIRIRQTLEQTGNTIDSLSTGIRDVRTELGIIGNSGMWEKLSELSGADGGETAGFLASPAALRTETMYGAENYGSAMAPFYTNLAVWVGGIILIAIFKLEADRDRRIPGFSPAGGYLGRWLLFIAFGLIQGFIVCAGDIWLLKIQCRNPAAFILTGLLCSFVYVTLIYTLSIAFKHIGKALSVLLVILQIPGSSGTYPIEMMPRFFQNIHPFLPFTYGVGAMREASAGIYMENFTRDLCFLILFVPAAFFIGFFLRPRLLNINAMFDERLAETEIMICEANGMKRKDSLSVILEATFRHKTWAEDLRSRAARFEKGYKKRVRAGFGAMAAITLVFFVPMHGMDAKMLFLIVWIASIVGISAYLIVNEYIHQKFSYQMALADMPEDKLEAMLKKGEEA